MTEKEYNRLYEKYLEGKCNEAEAALLLSYQDKFEYIQDDHSPLTAEEESIKNAVFERILTSTQVQPAKVVRLTRWRWIAAAAIVVVATAAILLFRTGRPLPTDYQAVSGKKANRFKPASPTLTLAHGVTIQLNKAGKGFLATDHETKISKADSGQLVYHPGQSAGETIADLNTLTIPRGNQYQVTLPDGTRVWLNAESALTYPTAFTGKTRTVTLKGEAYFEVAKNKDMPFIVQAGNTRVKVLGTHFNVMAYAGDAAVTTTLLEGSVSLSANDGHVLLSPGQQGTTFETGAQIMVKAVKVNEVVAWKDGYFNFHQTPIRDIMKKVSRWYDMEIVFKPGTKEEKFSGIYARNQDVSELLNGLELTGFVHFKVEGRRITVM